jgi:hypothetical protein
MQALLGVLQPLFKKIGDLFDLFDLSFLVAGGSSVLSILYVAGMLELGVGMPAGDAGVSWFLMALIMVTVWGLVSFAVGPLVRRLVSWLPGLRRAPWNGATFDAYLRDALAAHGLSGDRLVGEYLGRERAEYRLYVRLWAEVREAREVRDSFELLRRFWVLTASFDALATSGLFWCAAFAFGALRPAISPLDVPSSATAAGLSLFFGLCAAHEAARSRSNQVEELAATYAHLARRRAEAGATAEPPLDPAPAA